MLKLTEIPVAASTRKVYLNALSNLDKWLRGREATDETVSAYLSYLFDRGKSSGHAEGVLKAVRWRARSTKTEDPRGELCQNAIANFRRQGVGRGRGPCDGLTYEDADKLVALVAGERTVYGDRDAALIRVMSDAALRIGEAAAVDVEHLDFATHTLLIPKSKVDQLGRGAVQFLTDRAWELLNVWMERGKITDGPLFRPIHKTHHRVFGFDYWI